MQEDGTDRGGGIQVSSSDAIQLPATSRIFRSPDRQFELRIRAVDEWRTPRAVAELNAIHETRPSRIWDAGLEQPYGPRFAFVGNDGSVLMLDEWQNVNSRWAILNLDPAGAEASRIGLTELVSASGRHIRDFTSVARFGWWIQDAPRLGDVEGEILVPAAGATLVIDIHSGTWKFL